MTTEDAADATVSCHIHRRDVARQALYTTDSVRRDADDVDLIPVHVFVSTKYGNMHIASLSRTARYRGLQMG